MGYTWTDGELITATKLNNTGGGGTSGLVTDTSGTLDKSYNELMAILNNGTLPYIIYENATDFYFLLHLVKIYIEDGTYTAEFYGGDPGDPLDIYYINADADEPLYFD